jgi:hypothetical protein
MRLNEQEGFSRDLFCVILGLVLGYDMQSLR